MTVQKKIRIAKLFLVALSLSLGVSGCWDIVEINQLAIVNFVGIDRTGEKGKYSVYYQVINPAGIAAQKSVGLRAPVYTYKVESYTTGGFTDRMYNILPRKPFYDHYQALVVTKRFAKSGLRELLNFLEKRHDRRSTVYLLVTDSPISEIMKTYIPLERLPGRVGRSLIELESKYSGQASKQSRVKDLVENMENSVITVLPIVSLSGSTAKPTVDRYDQIDANLGNFILNGGAIFKQDRMVGELEASEMPMYHLLNGKIGVLQQTVSVNDENVDLKATKTTVRKKLTFVSGQPLLHIDIDADLELVDNDQNVKLNGQNLDEIESQFNRKVSERATEFFEYTKGEGWDLLGIEAQINRKRGKQWAEAKKDKDIWRMTQIKLTVNSAMDKIGVTLDPYFEKKG